MSNAEPSSVIRTGPLRRSTYTTIPIILGHTITGEELSLLTVMDATLADALTRTLRLSVVGLCGLEGATRGSPEQPRIEVTPTAHAKSGPVRIDNIRYRVTSDANRSQFVKVTRGWLDGECYLGTIMISGTVISGAVMFGAGRSLFCISCLISSRVSGNTTAR